MDGRVVRMRRSGRMADGRWDGRPRNAGRLLARRAARRREVLPGHGAHDADRAGTGARLSHDGVLTCPPG